MARNRKRAKERRARRPANGTARPGTATAGFDAPDPIEHATPDVELAEEQLAQGRPDTELEPDAEGDANADAADAEPGAAEELEDTEFGEAPNVPGVFPEPVRPRSTHDEVEDIELSEAEFEAEAEEAAEQAEAEEAEAEGAKAPATRTGAAPAEHRAGIFSRLVHFLQGSWRELQRVQWPDRRQVMQATGVVIGFVIVAGVFLGVADFISQKLVTYILK